MRRQQWLTGSLIVLTLFFLISCGKSDEEETVLESDNTIGAPPPPPPIDSDYPTSPVPSTTMPDWDYDYDFNRFNQTIGHCRTHLAHKGKLLKFLMALLSGREVVASSAESRGFKPGSRGGGCMGQLGDLMGHLRHWKGKFRSGALRNWVGHSADWAMDGTYYPSYWSNGYMPDYLGGSGQ